MSNKEKKIILWVSSITGNTKSIACILLERLLEKGYVPKVLSSPTAIADELADLYKVEKIQERDLADDAGLPVLLCFWCRRGGMDDRSAEFLKKIQGRRVLAFGTMGSYPDSEYGQAVAGSVKEQIETENEYAGLYLCRGRIDERRTEKRRQLPAVHRHYLDDEGYERHLSSRKHPDEDDKRGAAEYLDRKLSLL